MENKTFGANPPPDFDWQMGKSAGVIYMVRRLEDMKGDHPNHAEEIQRYIDGLKSGQISLDELGKQFNVEKA